MAGYNNGTPQNLPHFPRQGWRAFRDAEEMRLLAQEYFNHCTETKEPALMTGIALWLGFSKKTLSFYADGRYDSPGDSYSEVLDECRTYIEHGKLVGGLMGKWNSQIVKFDLSHNHGYAERKAVEVTGKDGAPVQHEDVTTPPDASIPVDKAARDYQDACRAAVAGVEE